MSRPNYKVRAKNLNKLVNKLRSNIKKKRSEKGKIVATLEAAEKIISNPNYWDSGSWFFVTDPEDKHNGGYIDSCASNYDELISTCSTDSNVCGVCAEGAIYLAADSLVDGKLAIDALNSTEALINISNPELETYESIEEYVEEYGCEPEGAIMDINDSSGRLATVKAFREGIAELKKEYKIK